MDTLQWMLQNAGDTLLLVAVDARAANAPGTYPCRVVGSFTQVAAPAAAELIDTHCRSNCNAIYQNL